MQQCRRIFSIFDAVRKNIFESNELQESTVVSILETTAADGKKLMQKLDFYIQSIIQGLLLGQSFILWKDLTRLVKVLFYRSSVGLFFIDR